MVLSGYKNILDETWYWGVYIARNHLNIILNCVDKTNV
jgi:hypothetical protein